MSYTIKDILERLINLEEEMSLMYKNLSNDSTTDANSVRILAKVMSKEEGRHAVYFKNINDSLTSEEKKIEIDFFTYDKVSQLMYEFKRKSNIPSNIDKISTFLNFVLNFEKENLALLIDIRGRFVKTSMDVDSYNYKILSNLIEEEKKHIDELTNLSKIS